MHPCSRIVIRAEPLAVHKPPRCSIPARSSGAATVTRSTSVAVVRNERLVTGMHKLERTTFETSRHAEYFSAKELTAQTGVRRIGFAVVVLKELVDNALDACEKADVSPVIGIEVHGTHSGGIEISVSDNGPGIPTKTVESILNFDTRTSDNAAYRSPSRGAQGNALKTIIGIPYALGSFEPVTIEAQGIVHKIRAWATPAGDVRRDYEQERVGPTVGTKVSVTVPRVGKDGTIQRFDPRGWARSFALFNPHATVKFVGFGEFSDESEHAESGLAKTTDFYQATVSGKFAKHRPNDKISPHWYDGPSLDFLIHSHIGAARKGQQDDLLLRDFVMQFKGLSATIKAKQVCELFPKVKYLSDFEHKDILLGTDKLLAAMQHLTDPPKHDVLGTVGKAHFEQRFEEMYGGLDERPV
jgi:hypothetical protein